MGIKFLCNHCGKNLNVKAFLAGKRGICPECGKKIVIPAQNAEATPLAEPVGASSSGAPVGGPAGSASAAGGSKLPIATPLGSASSGTPSALPASTHTATPTAVSVSTPTTASTATQGASVASVANAADPIDSAPNAMWYVRPASGGQFGPANGELLRNWIQQGRVAADSLLWHEGLPNWLQANLLLPQMSASSVKVVQQAGGQVAGAADATDMHETPRSVGGRRHTKRKSNATAITMLVILSILAAGLIAGLIFLLVK